jgi:hypothetical protein
LSKYGAKHTGFVGAGRRLSGSNPDLDFDAGRIRGFLVCPFGLCDRRRLPLGPALKKKAHSKYTTVQVEEVGALFDAGLTGPQIAAKTGHPLSTVYVLLRRAGRRRSAHSKPRPSRGFTSARRRRIVEAYEAGAPIHEIKTRERIGANSVRRVLLEEGVALRGVGGGPSVHVKGPIVGRWRLLDRADDDEAWSHIATGKVARLTDRGDEVEDGRYIVLEPGDDYAAYSTREAALEAIARGFKDER